MALVEDSKKNHTVIILIALQLLAWLIVFIPFYGDYTSSDAAGNAMAKGIAYLLITAPGMIFIFISNFYLIFKKALSKWIRILSVINFIGLFILFNSVNW